MTTADSKINRSRSDGVERLHAELTASLQALVTSEDWQRALAVATRFRQYSFANTQLIWSQAAARGFTPTRVAGYRMWQQLGRQVRRGERGIGILAPIVRKVDIDDRDDERRVVGFRGVHVFDISQTDGGPLPEITATLVEGDLPAHWGEHAGLISDAGFAFQVGDSDRLGAANGITDWQHQQVTIRPGLPGAQRFKTAVHELAHIRLHEPASGTRPACRGVVEVEAESVAYMVCAGLGIDSAGYSLAYVASWSGGDVEKVTATANRVIGCARDVLTGLEPERRLEPDPPRIVGTVRHETPNRDVAERVPSHSSDLDEILAAATRVYGGHLGEPIGAQAREYLQQRGIGADAADGWQLGYAPESWQTLTDALRHQGFTDELLVASGVAGRARTGRLYDRMRGRLIFPIHDQEARPRGFAGRLVIGDGPKYLNTPETDVYQKRTLLYGMYLARQPITETGYAVVVEGYTDAIAAHQAGFTNVVATGGTAFAPQQLDTLEPITREVTLAFDGDQAGLAAAQQTAELDPADRHIQLRVASLPAGQDPADLLTTGNHHLLREAIADAVPLEHHLIDQILSQHNLDEPEAMVRAIRTAASVAAPITGPAARAQTITYLANRIGRDETTIQRCIEDRASQPGLRRRRNAGRNLI